MTCSISTAVLRGKAEWKILAALEAEGLIAEINLVNVKDEMQAERWKFLGSPSFQVDGVDWWPEERANYQLSCRVYSTPKGMKGAPTVEMLREKLRAQSNTLEEL